MQTYIKYIFQWYMNYVINISELYFNNWVEISGNFNIVFLNICNKLDHFNGFLINPPLPLKFYYVFKWNGSPFLSIFSNQNNLLLTFIIFPRSLSKCQKLEKETVPDFPIRNHSFSFIFIGMIQQIQSRYCFSSFFSPQPCTRIKC